MLPWKKSAKDWWRTACRWHELARRLMDTVRFARRMRVVAWHDARMWSDLADAMEAECKRLNPRFDRTKVLTAYYEAGKGGYSFRLKIQGKIVERATAPLQGAPDLQLAPPAQADLFPHPQ